VTKPASITVVVPCYNAAGWISVSLRSALTQDWPALEVLVVDDGSTDNSVDLVKSQFPAVRVLQQRNGGAAAARNAGIQAARGDWIAFLDSDDFWLPGKLRAQMELLSARPEAQISSTSWEFWDSEDADPTAELLSRLQTQETSQGQSGPAAVWVYHELLLGCYVWTSTVVARTELLRKLGGFDTGLKIGEDYDLWLRASRLTPLARVHRPLALYRLHPASLTKQTPAVNYEADVVGRAVERWGYASPDGRHARPADVSRSLARTWQNFGAAHLEAGHSKQALRGGLKSIGEHWQGTNGWKLTGKALYQSLRTLVQPLKT